MARELHKTVHESRVQMPNAEWMAWRAMLEAEDAARLEMLQEQARANG